MIRLVVGISGKRRLREHIEAHEGQPISFQRLDAEWTDLTQEGGPRLTPNVLEHLRRIDELIDPMAALIHDKPWMLLCFQKRVLVTSDHPVALLADSNAPPWLGVGIATAGA